jgi:hypothetical protein
MRRGAKGVRKGNEPSINQSTARGPVQLEVSTVGARDRSTIESQGLVSRLRAGELDKAVPGVTDTIVS